MARILEVAPEPDGREVSARTRLILTGERLIATSGLDAVSLRQVAAESGTANRSAVRYHFGSREGLVQAIIEHRLPRLSARRRALLADAVADGAAPQLRDVVRAYVVPLLEEGEDDESWFVGFVAQLQQFGADEHPFDRSAPELQHPSREFLALIASFLTKLPEPVRSNRVAYAAAMATHVAADRQRARRHNPAGVQLVYPLFVADLLDTIVGGLEAPPSAETRRALKPQAR